MKQVSNKQAEGRMNSGDKWGQTTGRLADTSTCLLTTKCEGFKTRLRNISYSRIFEKRGSQTRGTSSITVIDFVIDICANQQENIGKATRNSSTQKEIDNMTLSILPSCNEIQVGPVTAQGPL